METCRLNDFMKVLEPWLDRDYIRKAYLDDQNQLVLYFTDGGQQTYRIDDCSRDQLQGIIEEMQRKNIPVEKQLG